MSTVEHTAATAERDFPVTFSYYVRLVARRWWIPASLAVLGACLSLVYSGLQPTTYRAQAIVALSPLDPTTADELPRLTPTVARILRSDPVLLDARKEYAAASPDEDPARTTPKDLRARTAVTVPRDTSLFEVTADGPTQADADALARAVVAAASRRVSSLGDRPKARTRTGETVPLSLDVFGPPVAEGKVSPTPMRNLIVCINIGLIVGIVGAALLRDPRRARMRADDLASLLNASDLVYTPLPSPRLLRDRPVPGITAPKADSRGEGIRLLGGRMWQWLQDDRRVVLLLGDLPPEKLRSIALRLAAHVARTGIRPAVLEADFHGTGWTSEHGDADAGLGPRLEGKNGSAEHGEVDVETSTRNGDGPGAFTVVRRGESPQEPALAFASDEYRKYVADLTKRHELLLVVGPSTEWQAEVFALAENSDAVVLLVPAWVPRSRAAALTTLRSASVDASVLVSVFGDAEDVPLSGAREL